MWHVIEYLNDPYLVLKVQKFYGIRKYEPSVQEDNSVCGSDVNNLKGKTCIKDASIAKSNDFNVTGVNKNGVVLRSSKKTNRPTSDHEDVFSSDSETECKNYVITNWFWYYLFVFGTELGDEVFYATFIPFWFWNIDGAVGRRVVMVWTIIMYIGQGIKDIICWPRPPSPPVFRLQKKWAQEYGMPSTHAMVGISIPFSVVLYTINRYQYPLSVGLFIATSWCTVMCISRIYLGMHSILDIVAGLLLALVLMIPVVPFVDSLDHLILTSKWSPIFLIMASILLIIIYPKGQGNWTPTRGDTILVVSVCVGVLIGAWANYQSGKMSEPTTPPPYNVIWPSYGMIGLSILRTVIGMCCVVGIRAFCKSILYASICYLTKDKTDEIDSDARSNEFATNCSSISTSDDNNKYNVIADSCHKYFTYLVMGFFILYILPNVFHLLRIERPTFYTEI